MTETFQVSFSKLSALLVFAWLLAWPGLPAQRCTVQTGEAHNCCAKQKTSCGCESKSKPKLCNCSKRVNSEVASITPAVPLAVVQHVCLVLDFLPARMVLSSAVPPHRLYEARGPTDEGLTATQIALPPPA